MYQTRSCKHLHQVPFLHAKCGDSAKCAVRETHFNDVAVAARLQAHQHAAVYGSRTGNVPCLQAIYGGNAKDAVLIVGGVHVNNVAVILDYGLTSVLLFMAAKSFKRVLKSNEHQLQFVMQVCTCHHWKRWQHG